MGKWEGWSNPNPNYPPGRHFQRCVTYEEDSLDLYYCNRGLDYPLHKGITHLRASRPDMCWCCKPLGGARIQAAQTGQPLSCRFREYLLQQLTEWSEVVSHIWHFVYIFLEHDRRPKASPTAIELGTEIPYCTQVEPQMFKEGFDSISFKHGDHEFQNSDGGFVYWVAFSINGCPHNNCNPCLKIELTIS